VAQGWLMKVSDETLLNETAVIISGFLVSENRKKFIMRKEHEVLILIL